MEGACQIGASVLASHP